MFGIQDKQTVLDENLYFFSEIALFYSENIRAHIDSVGTLAESVHQSIEACRRFAPNLVTISNY